MDLNLNYFRGTQACLRGYGLCPQYLKWKGLCHSKKYFFFPLGGRAESNPIAKKAILRVYLQKKLLNILTTQVEQKWIKFCLLKKSFCDIPFFRALKLIVSSIFPCYFAAAPFSPVLDTFFSTVNYSVKTWSYPSSKRSFFCLLLHCCCCNQTLFKIRISPF